MKNPTIFLVFLLSEDFIVLWKDFIVLWKDSIVVRQDSIVLWEDSIVVWEDSIVVWEKYVKIFCRVCIFPQGPFFFGGNNSFLKICDIEIRQNR